MGYSLRIGEAVVGEIDWDELEPGEFPHVPIGAELEGHDEAPTFPNDRMTGNSNSRHPSYGGWAEFCEATGLHRLFYGRERHEQIPGHRGGLLARHPGVVLIGPNEAAAVQLALRLYRVAHPDAEPGFEGYPFEKNLEPVGPNVDAQLARLIWLDYWMTWAVNNCEHPVLENS